MSEAQPAMVIRPFEAGDEEQVIDLWHRCGLVIPANEPRRDIALKMQFQPQLFFVGVVGARVTATVMVGYEGHRGWINYLAIAPDLQRHGLGRQIMDRAEAELHRLGCPKVNLMVRSTNHAVVEFYQRLGYLVEDRVCMSKRFP
jgi:ribosomal protein S18 acetylase RimI-like enzyme